MRAVLSNLICACVHFAFYLTTCAEAAIDQSPDGQSGTIKFGPPDLSDEVESSLFVPDSLKCDSCKAIAYQMWSQFTEYNKKHKFYKSNLPESVVIDLVEDICEGDNVWKEYGLKQVMGSGKQILSGPGLDSADTPGVMQSGGKWPGRLRDMCEVFAGEFGETTIYKVFNKSQIKLKSLEDYLCHGRSNSLGGSCTPRQKTAKQDL